MKYSHAYGGVALKAEATITKSKLRLMSVGINSIAARKSSRYVPPSSRYILSERYFLNQYIKYSLY